MSAPTTTRSAYPAPVDELMPAARDLASELGPDLSRNKLMKHLRIGDEKARTILDRLQQEQTPAPEPTEPGDEGQPPAGETPEPEVAGAADPGTTTTPKPARTVSIWPVFLLAAPAFIAIWSGWVGLGSLTGFGPVRLLPGIADQFTINSAITLPIGMETYAAYALRVWLTPGLPARARQFAKWSSVGSLALGAAGQIAYHLMTAAGMTHAPWQITTAVACLPVAVLGLGAALVHLLRNSD